MDNGTDFLMDSTTFSWENSTIYEKSMEDYIEYKISWKIFQIYVPICCLVGICGNTMSFFVLVLSTLKNTSTCIYMAVIACLDTVILSVVLVYHVSRYPGTRVFHTWTCSVITFLFYFTIHFDTLIILAMTVERYIVVKFPLKAASITRKKTLLTIGGIGVFSFFLNLHTFFTRKMGVSNGVERCVYDSDMDKFFVTKVYPWIDSTVYCFIPMSSVFILNILIICNLRKAAQIQMQMAAQRTSKNNANIGENRAQKQVTMMLVLVSLAFLCLAGPIAIIIIIQRYTWIAVTPYERAINWLAHSFADNLMYTNHAINFILYLLSGQRFRRELKNLLCLKEKKYEPSNSNRPSSKSECTGTTSDSNITITLPLDDKITD